MYKLLLSLACLAGFCAQGDDSQRPVTGPVPRIVVVGNSVTPREKNRPVNTKTAKLGKIAGYGRQTVQFRFKNMGNAPAEILELRPSCSCISGTADKTRLGLQEEAVITVALDASLVHSGDFKRLLWVKTNDPESSNIHLSLEGEALPLFSGLPESPQKFVLAEGATWTNRFTLTETETNLFLGTPILTADATKLRATATLATNTQEKTSFDITLVVTPLVPGKHQLSLSLPVEGQPNVKPLRLAFLGNVGTEELKAVPSKMMLLPTSEPLTRQLHIKTAEKNPDTRVLTWTPKRNGVSVTVQPSPKDAYLTVTLTLSAEAVASLLKEKDAQLTFHYPNYRPANVDFFARPETPEGVRTVAKGRPSNG